MSVTGDPLDRRKGKGKGKGKGTGPWSFSTWGTSKLRGG